MVSGKVGAAWDSWIGFVKFHIGEEKANAQATAHAEEVLAHVQSIETLRREKEEHRRAHLAAVEKNAATIETMQLQTEVYEQQVGNT